MKLSHYLLSDQIIENLEAQSKKGVLEELAGVLVRKDSELDYEELVSILLEREKLGSTGIGRGVAIPHGKVKDIDSLAMAFGRSAEGIEFQSIDGKPVHLFFLLIAPENSAGIHLKALARITRMFKNEETKERFMAATSADEIYRIIVERDEEEG